jgi:hypothetical protein
MVKIQIFALSFFSLLSTKALASIPTEAMAFEVRLNMKSFSKEQEEKILKAADLIKKVISSEEFRDAVLNHEFQGKRTFSDSENLTNEEIYQKIIAGSEELNPGNNNAMDLNLVLYTDKSNVVGYTYPRSKQVWMNSKYLNKNTPAKVTANMMHEWLHKLGFKHAVERTPERAFSVPYAIGYMIAEMAMKHEKAAVE